MRRTNRQLQEEARAILRASLTLSRVEQRGSGQRVGMVADVTAVGAFKHGNACVVIDCHNPDGDAGKQLRTMFECRSA